MVSPEFLIYAHRGQADTYPENTLLSFKDAIRKGCNGIELDVQLSRDGHVVVIHDYTLQRTTNGQGRVNKQSLKQLKQWSAGAWFHPRFHACKIPTLDEVFKLVKNHPVHLNIELKNLIVPMPKLEQKVISRIKKYRLTHRVVLSTYNINSLKKIKQLDPSIHTALLYFGKLKAPWKWAKELQASYLHPPYHQVTPLMVRKLHQQKIGICPYLINNEKSLRHMIHLGVDGVITEVPQKAISLIQP